MGVGSESRFAARVLSGARAPGSERLARFVRLVVLADAAWVVALDDDDLPTIVRARLLPAR
jgi:hypothetical protein